MTIQTLENPGGASLMLNVARLNPAEVELHTEFQCIHSIQNPKLQGRLMGPRNVYGETVEIAYPLRKWKSADSKKYVGRIVIPEPSFWDPVAPLQYAGPLELWDGDTPIVKAWATIGFHARQLVRGQLVWNGHPLSLRGRNLTHLDEATVRELRHENYNTVVLPVDDQAITFCELANRLGMLLLFATDKAIPQALVDSVSEYACCLGWLLPPTVEMTTSNQALFGLDATKSPVPAALSAYHFIFGAEATIGASELPKLLFGATESTTPGPILGTITND